jgi:two-component system sensor histidine kinase RpfC
MAHILVVDDNDLLRATVQLQLEEGGHSVTLAGNGREALACLEREGFDLVISDIFMPEVEGIEFIRTARERYRRLPIIAMTGGSTALGPWGLDAGIDFLHMAAALGATRTLNKPFTRDRLLTLVEECLALPPGEFAVAMPLRRS